MEPMGKKILIRNPLYKMSETCHLAAPSEGSGSLPGVAASGSAPRQAFVFPKPDLLEGSMTSGFSGLGEGFKGFGVLGFKVLELGGLGV